MKRFSVVATILLIPFLLTLGTAAFSGEIPAGVWVDNLPLMAAMGPPAMAGGPPAPPRPDGPGAPGPFGPPPPIPIGGPAPGAWWKDAQIVRQLDLSDAQVARIGAAFLEHRLRLVDLRADLEKQELGLPPLLDADRPDDGMVAAQIDLITAARGRLEKEHTLMLLAIRHVLTPEQWKQLQALHRDRAPVDGAPPPGMLPPGRGGSPPR